MLTYYSIKGAEEGTVDLGHGHHAGTWQHMGPNPKTAYYDTQHDRFLAGPVRIPKRDSLRTIFSKTSQGIAAKIEEKMAPGSAGFGNTVLENSGSTTALAIIRPDRHIITANLGDSRINLYIVDGAKKVRGYNLTTDHNAENKKEVKRARKAEGIVADDRFSLPNTLRCAVSRAFGVTVLEKILTHEPEIPRTFNLKSHAFNLQDGERVIITATSDGAHRNLPLPYHVDALQQALDENLPLNTPDALARHFATVQIKPHPGSDNATAVAAEIDFSEKPAFVIGIMDGMGDSGWRISEAARDLLSAELILKV